MRTARNVMSVAPRSMAECAASERIASEPDKRPTIAFAAVRPPEASTGVSGTFFLLPCLAAPAAILAEIGAGFLQRLAIFADQPRAKLGRGWHVVNAADALTRGPDVLPRPLFVLAHGKLLVRRRKIDLDAGGIDAWLQEV